MHWSLDYVRDLGEDEYDELIAWAQERSKPKDDDSMDIDAVIDAKKAKPESEDSE